MQRNISISYFKSFFRYLYLFIPIWYAFETQYAPIAVLGVIYAVSHGIAVVLELPTGALADMIGRKKTVFIGLLFGAVAYFLISQTRSVSWLWLGYIVHGASAALVSGADVALQFDSLKELGKEKQYMKISASIGFIVRSALILGILLGGYAYVIHQRLPYFLVGLSLLVATFLTLFNTEPQIDTENFTLRNYIKQTKIGFRELFKNRYVRDFSIFYIFVGGITWYFMFFLNQAYATEIGFTAIERSWLFASIYLLVSLINIGLTRLKSLKRRHIYVLFPILLTLGYIPGYWATKPFSIVLIFLVQFAGIARFALLDQYSNLEFESKYRATAISALNMAVSFLFILIALLGGKIIELYGVGFIMSALGVMAFATTVPTAYILLTRHRDRE